MSASLFAIACAKGTTEDIGDAGITPADAGEDLRPRFDSAPPEDDGGETDAGEDGGNCTRRVVINELAPRSAAGATIEFIELYNAGTCAAPIGGWKLPYKSSTGGGNTTLYNFEQGASIAAKAFFLLGTPGFTGAKDAEMTVGMADDGQIALVDEKNETIDSVAYGTTTGPYVEKSPAPAPPTSGSVGRKSDGVDTNDNAADFKTFATPSPGATN